MASPLRPTTPSAHRSAAISRRSALIAGAVGVPGAIALAPSVALAEEPVDPDVTGGDTRIEDVALADVALEQIDGAGAVRLIESVGTMLGVTWSGTTQERIEVRGLGADGTWGEWLALAPATDPMTDLAIDGTQPAWLGAVSGMQVLAERGGQDVTTELTAHVITTSRAATDRSASAAAAQSPAPAGAAGTGGTGGAGSAVVPALGPLPMAVSAITPGPNAPTFITRAGWGADESLTSGVSTSSSFRSVVIHHAEGSNSYSKDQAAQLIRGILTYHTQTQKWSDVGYNAFVDQYGQIFEGRKGGLTKNIVGAHARGYNSTTYGICVLGSYTSVEPSGAALTAIAQIAGWRLLSSFTPVVASTSPFESTSSGTKYPVGSVNNLPRIMAHRDVNLTDCCGKRLYNQLGTIRSRAQGVIDGAWRGHLNVYQNDGGADALGTVTEVLHAEGPYWVTRLTRGLIISDGFGYIASYGSTFGRAWEASWGRPVESVLVSGPREIQVFEKGVAVRENGSVFFSTTRFVDVPRSAQFYAEIDKLAARGVVTGWSDHTYRPLDLVNRDAMIAFVYRAMGSPAFTPPATSPFTDITPSTQFYKEICWALSRKIASGYPDGTFRPVQSVERGAVAAFLHRAAGSPKVTGTGAPFSDVAADHPFRAPIAWMASSGISTGWPDGTFRPSAGTTRDAMAAFMVRWMTATGR